jgi:hypothetical protein
VAEVSEKQMKNETVQRNRRRRGDEEEEEMR